MRGELACAVVLLELDDIPVRISQLRGSLALQYCPIVRACLTQCLLNKLDRFLLAGYL